MHDEVDSQFLIYEGPLLCDAAAGLRESGLGRVPRQTGRHNFVDGCLYFAGTIEQAQSL